MTLDDTEELKRALDAPPVTREEHERSRKLFWEAMDSLTYDPDNLKPWNDGKPD